MDYYENNYIPNEKLFYPINYHDITFRVNSLNFFIENIYTTNNLYGLKYIEDAMPQTGAGE